MTKIDPIYIGSDAISHLIHYCQAHGLDSFTLIADQNTYRAAGEAVEAALRTHGYDVQTMILTGDEIVADAHFIVDVLVDAPVEPRTYIAVGSGTLTDITRFASHRTRCQFLSFPTAPSVDGFASVGAPLVLHGVKLTILCQTPLAIFGDIDVLSSAPKALIAAGFGDLLAKITSTADWRLGRLLWNEPYDDTIAERSLKAVESCMGYAAEIGSGSHEGVRRLMDGLIETGMCMVDFGNSRPASGAEHHCSHYWEMKLLREGRPAILHGAKVGVATAMMAERYDFLRTLSRETLLERLEGAELPDREAEIAHMRAAYGADADEVIEVQKAFLNLSQSDYDHMKHQIVEKWDEIQQIIATVPPAADIRRMLEQVGGHTNAAALGLDADEVAQAQQYGHYLRDRLTVLKLGYLFNLQP